MLVCPVAKVAGEYSLLMESDFTTRAAETASWLVAPSKVCKAPAGMSFVYDFSAASILALTVTVMVQIEPAGMVPPVRLNLFGLGDEIVSVPDDPPVQVNEGAGELSYSKPAGRLSSKVALV